MKTPVYRLIFKVFHAQRNQVRPRMAEIGLSPGQPKILDHLAAGDRCMQKEIAAVCEIEPATVSKLLDGMEGSGLVRRVPSKEDRRSGCVVITEKGRALQRQSRERFDEIASMELAGFTEEEREQFSAYRRRVYRNLTGRETE